MSDKLDYYLKAWNLACPQLLAETPTSHVYTVMVGGEMAVLKWLTSIGEEERTGAVALRCFDGHGAVRLLRHDHHAHLLEYAEGEDLIPLVKSGEDEQATRIIADVLNQLHYKSGESPPDGLVPLGVWFRSLFNRAEQDKRDGLNSIYRRAAPIAEALLNTPRDVRVLHGDIHHENIRHSATRGWLALDPKGLYGERTYDAANTLCNPINMPDLVENERRLLKNAAILAEKLSIDLTRILTFVFVYACLSASWSLEDGQDERHTVQMAQLAEPHIYPP